MLDSGELAATVAAFGATEEQVRRDHLISHLLAALSRSAEEVLFFGGTALARTHLPQGRLSEDIDLIARTTRSRAARALQEQLVSGVRREYPGLRWTPLLTQVRRAEPALLVAPGGITVRIQLLDGVGYAAWPFEWRDVFQRYSDAPAARLLVPTRAAFVGWKTVAWVHRHAPRDLFDLCLLAQAGAIDSEAAELYRRLGPTGGLPSHHDFAVGCDEEAWRRSLSAQTRLTIRADEALDAVQRAWSARGIRGDHDPHR